MHSKSIVVAVLIGAGAALGWATMHFNRDSGDERVAEESQEAADRAAASPFARVATPSRESTKEPTTYIARPSAPAPFAPKGRAQRRPEADADPADVPTAPEDFPTYDENADRLAEEHVVPADKSGLSDANERAAALREIDTSTPASFPILEQTLRSDPVARNRLLAVKSLRLLGKQAGNADRARDVLRVAMSDADQNVSTNARDAYDELAR
jgi:hypothetical protein